MATLDNGGNNSKRSRGGISFEFQSKDLPSRRLLGKGLSGIGYETAWNEARRARKDFVGVQRDIFLQEAGVLVRLEDHENIVKTYGWTVDKRSCSLVLEYVDEDLLSFLQKRMDSKRGVVGKDLGKPSSTSTSTQPVDLAEAADMSEAVDMMLQIATGVEYLHEKGLAHGDLKTKNILVTHRKDGDQSSKVLKMSDFGLVGTKRKSKYIVSRKVRKLDMVRWKSPECLKILGRRFQSSNCDEDETSSESESESAPSSVPESSSVCAVAKASDVYSFGLICYQILTGQSPYPYLDWKELQDKILSGLRPDLSPVSLHPLLRELLMSCWGDSAERPSFSTVCLKLKRVQVLLTTAMGKRPQEAVTPSLANSPAHQAPEGSSTEVSTSFSNSLLSEPSRGPAVVPSGWTASVVNVTRNSPGLPLAAASEPSPPATALASPAADAEFDESTQSEDLSVQLCQKTALPRDVKAAFDPDMYNFWELPDQLDSTSSGLNHDPFIRWDLSGTKFLGKFIENEVPIRQHCHRSATGVQTGTADIWRAVPCKGTPSSDSIFLQPTPASFLQQISAYSMQTSSASLPGPFKIWRNARDLPPFQRKRENSKNQWLLRRCLEILREMPHIVQTHGDVVQSTVSQGRPLISSCKSDILTNMDTELFPHYMASASLKSRCASSTPHLVDDEVARTHMLAERGRRVKLRENFAALRRLVPIISRSDYASMLGDAIVYLKDLQMQIDELEANKTQVERQYKILKLSHQDLEQRNQQLEASMSLAEREYEDLKLTFQDLERRNQQLEARIFQV